MKAITYNNFGDPLIMQTVPDPKPEMHGVVLEVKATGLCRSDWHGWMGHDSTIKLPHVPGHELAGVIVAVGEDVVKWQVGDRVTLPFVGGCGQCQQCLTGNQQVCDHQFQPGFTHWGSFAELVAIDYADVNLVGLPPDMAYETAAGLGCRFGTAFRAMVHQGQVSAGQWVAVHGCGGVGLSAIMIANALGAQVIAIDISPDKLTLAQAVGAVATINAAHTTHIVNQVIDITHGGAHVSLDALGSTTTCFNSIANLRKRGKHIQVGLMVGQKSHPAIPMDTVIANELKIIGSHGIQAHQYPRMLEMIQAGKLHPQKLIGKRIDLAEVIEELPQMNKFKGAGITMINN